MAVPAQATASAATTAPLTRQPRPGGAGRDPGGPATLNQVTAVAPATARTVTAARWGAGG